MSKHLITLVVALLGSVGVFAADLLATATGLIIKAQYPEAVRILDPLAKGGSSEAQYHLGLLYYSGKGVPEDEKKAVQLLISSAQQGHVGAMYQLGNAFTFGNETSRMVADADIEAANWYFKAAKLGNSDAQYSLGLLFMAGKGLVKNEKEALYWMENAAKNGHKDAKNYVSTRK